MVKLGEVFDKVPDKGQHWLTSLNKYRREVDGYTFRPERGSVNRSNVERSRPT